MTWEPTAFPSCGIPSLKVVKNANNSFIAAGIVTLGFISTGLCIWFLIRATSSFRVELRNLQHRSLYT